MDESQQDLLIDLGEKKEELFGGQGVKAPFANEARECGVFPGLFTKDGQAAFTNHLVSVLAGPEVMVAVVEEGGNVVGFCLAHIETLPEWFGRERIGLIRYVAVSEDSRGKGIGFQITTFVLDWFRSFGIRGSSFTF